MDFATKALGYLGMEIPIHTQESLENYFINGWEPGGFLTAMLAMDMQRAVISADTANRQNMWCIGKWITDNAPPFSWGSYDDIDLWCHNIGGRRTKFAEEIHKKHMWNILKST
jgi:hypothetical protein